MESHRKPWEKLKQPNRHYNFSLHAVNTSPVSLEKLSSGQSSPLDGKDIDWQSTGKVRLEEFIYPSLLSPILLSPTEKKKGGLPSIQENDSPSLRHSNTMPTSPTPSMLGRSMNSHSVGSIGEGEVGYGYDGNDGGDGGDDDDDDMSASTEFMSAYERRKLKLERASRKKPEVFTGTLKWKVKLSENSEYAAQRSMIETLLNKKQSLNFQEAEEARKAAPLREREIEGEIHVRNQMKNKARRMLYERERRKREAERNKGNLLIRDRNEREKAEQKKGNQRGTRWSTVMSGDMRHMIRLEKLKQEETQDGLYLRLVDNYDDKRKAVKENKAKAEDGTVTRAITATSLNSMSEEEETYYRQKQELQELLDDIQLDANISVSTSVQDPSSTNIHVDDDIMEGLLFYRMQNEFNTREDASSDGSSRHNLNSPRLEENIKVSEVDYPMAAQIQERSMPLKGDIVDAIEKQVKSTAHPNRLTRVKRSQVALHHGYRGEDYTGLREEEEEEEGTLAVTTTATKVWPEDYIDTSVIVRESINKHPYSTSKRLSQDILSPIKLRPRLAQDKLFLTMMEANQLPENLFRIESNSLHDAMQDKTLHEHGIDKSTESGKQDMYVINLTNYGVGDEKGLSLSKALIGFDRISKFIVGNNRLTKKSIPALMSNLSTVFVRHIDISHNNLRGSNKCALALGRYFKKENVCQHLNVSHCHFSCKDLQILCAGLQSRVYQSLEEIDASHNDIKSEGATHLSKYLSMILTGEMDPTAYAKKTVGNAICPLKKVNLGWNIIKTEGAIAIAEAISISTQLQDVDLSANAISDFGAQELGDSLLRTNSLIKLTLAQNYIASPACFVFSRTLRNHPSMQALDLCSNPLGEPGARSIFRTILKGLRCFVMMRNCTFNADDTMFNHSNPGIDSPYDLDLTVPYDRAIVSEIVDMTVHDPLHCQMQNIEFNGLEHATDTVHSNIHLSVSRELENFVDKSGSGSKAWVIPRQGRLHFAFRYAESIPSASDIAKDSAMNILAIIIYTARTEYDRQQWLRLLCADVLCTTVQATKVIDTFIEKQTIGLGGLRTFDVVCALWSNLIDVQNAYPFLCKYIDMDDRKKLIHALGVDIFKFNWYNPTGHWRFNLENTLHRTTMMKFVAINRVESKFSQRKSRREDTSQEDNWFNFRNATYSEFSNPDEEVVPGAADGIEVQKYFIIDETFIQNLPYSGVIEFDYVSTKRPFQGMTSKEANAPRPKDIQAEATVHSEGSVGSRASSPLQGQRKRTDSDLGTNHEVDGQLLVESEQHPGLEHFETETERDVHAIGVTEATEGENAPIEDHEQDADEGLLMEDMHPRDMIVTESQLFEFLQALGLNSRERCVFPDTVFKLIYMQIASTKYYFKATDVCNILDTFDRDPSIQAKVVSCLFSRLFDLHNMDIILKQVSTDAQREIINRLGYLNVINPLKPAMDYQIYMVYPDERKMLVNLLELAPSEAHDQVRDNNKTDISIVDLYGSLSRVLKNCTDQMVLFNYGEMAERSTNISWNLRNDLLKRFLVGSYPIDKEMYKLINMYYKLVKSKDFSMGSIEQQYLYSLKRKKAEAESQVRRRKQSSSMATAIASPRATTPNTTTTTTSMDADV